MDQEPEPIEEAAVAEPFLVPERVATAAPARVKPSVAPRVPWVPRTVPLATVKAVAVGAAIALGIVGACVGDARARIARIERAPIVLPSVEAVTPPPSPPPTVPAPTAPMATAITQGQGLRSRAPQVRAVGVPTMSGSGALPAEVVTRIVRQHHGRFRLCYEAGLRSRPDLAGRIAVKLVIDRSGSVSTASASTESTLPDPSVQACVVRSFMPLSFPAPDRGIATVVYRLSFTVE